MAGITTHFSVITLIYHGLNSPIKRHRKEVWIKNKTLPFESMRNALLTSKDKHRLIVKGWIKTF
jgi:hypothetical protein